MVFIFNIRGCSVAQYILYENHTIFKYYLSLPIVTTEVSRKMAGLTNKEKAYLLKLNERNRNIENPRQNKTFYTGLTKPMSPKERKVRQRIVAKAENMAGYLHLVFAAGLLPNRRNSTKSPASLAHDASIAIMIYELDKKDNKKEE